MGGYTEGNITTGGFEFDEPTMRHLIKEWNDLGDSYHHSIDASGAMVNIVGPGLDFASQAHADAANASGRAYQRYLMHNRDYCYAQARLFQEALNDYLGVEESNASEIGASGAVDENDSKAGF